MNEYSYCDQMALPSQQEFINRLKPLSPSALLALADNCAICMDDEVTDAIKLNCKGQHVFCTKCSLKWFESSASCPMCREVLYHRQAETDEEEELSESEEDAADEAYVLELVNDVLTCPRPHIVLHQPLVYRAARHYAWFQRVRQSYRRQRREFDHRLITVQEVPLGLAAFVAAFALFKNLPPGTTREEWADVTDKVFGAIRWVDGLTTTARGLFRMMNAHAECVMETFEQPEAYRQAVRNMLHSVVSCAHWTCGACQGRERDF